MLTRRAVLRSGGLVLVSLGLGPRFLHRLAASSLEEGSRPKVLVSIFLRGAMDGLMAVPPLDETVLQLYRPRLTIGGAQAGLDPLFELDGRFGLHPAFEEILPFWEDGRLAIVHGVGSPNPTRSHFDAQDYMETGTPWRKGTADGWLNRVARRVAHDRDTFSAVSMTSRLPRSLQGDHGALAVEDLANFRLIGGGHEEDPLVEIYRQSSNSLLRQHGAELFDAMKLLTPEAVQQYRATRSVNYPPSKLGQSLLQIAFLIKAGVGLRIAFAESGGWDTHVRQGIHEGQFAEGARDLSQAIAAFWTDLDLYQDDVVVLTMTEFGRTVRENGSAGTDHGHGSCLFVLGQTVDGGRVHGEIPELVPENFFEGRDLPVTTDFRAVFAEVAGKLFGIADDSRIFPDWDGLRLPLLY